MKEDKLTRILIAGVAAVVLAPIIVNTTLATVGLVANGVEKIKYNLKIKKGLKDGSIVEIDGKYYEVVVDDVEEA